jgi:hypothetical protein
MRRFQAAIMVGVTVAALAPIGVVASGPGWAIQPTPNLIRNNASALDGVSCTSQTACTAVGVFDGGLPYVERWNGTSWVIQATPNPSGAIGSDLFGVSCASAATCTAIGYYTNDGVTYLSLAEGWNGINWATQATPNPSGTTFSAFTGVSCTSATACTAVGYYGKSSGGYLTLAARWNGSSWAIQATPNPSGAMGSRFSGVSCTSATACTAVGTYINSGGITMTLVERWNGTSWAIQATPTPSGAKASVFSGVSCVSATACTAAGYYIAGAVLTLAERWNGASWAIQATPNPSTSSSFSGVSCASATACTAAGHSASSVSNVTLAERWNGSSWAIQATPNPSGAMDSVFNGVSCASATTCTAVGSYSNSSGTSYLTLAEGWNGWVIQGTSNPSGATTSILRGVSCTSAAACTAVGYYFNSGGTGVTLAERWNGTGWAIQATLNPSGAAGSFLYGVSCTSATACTAVGTYHSSSGTFLTLAERWNGTTWAIQASPNPNGATGSILNGVSCASATACTATGYYTNSGGTNLTLAERWNGSSWAIQTIPNPSGATGSFLDGVSCPSATACTATGTYLNGGVYLTLAENWNGTSWAIQVTPNPSGATGSVFNGVSCASATACTAAGYYTNSIGTNATLVERWNGSSWAIQATPNYSGATGSVFNGVFCASATACTAAGYYTNSGGTNVTLVESWNGTSWAAQVTPNPLGALSSVLWGVSCASATACTAVGYYTNSGGTNLTLAER